MMSSSTTATPTPCSIPLRWIIVGLVLIVGVAVGTATLVPTLNAATTAVDENIQRLRENTMARIHQTVSAYFQQASSLVVTLEDLFQNDVLKAKWTPSPSSPIAGATAVAGFEDQYAANVLLPTLCSVQSRDAFETYIGNDDGVFYDCQAGIKSTIQYRNLTTGNLLTVKSYLVNGSSQQPIATVSPGSPAVTGAPGTNFFTRLVVDPTVVNDDGPYDPRQRGWYAGLKQKAGWSDVYVDFGRTTAAITIGGPLVYQGASVGAVARDVSTVRFQNLTSKGLSPRSISVLVDAASGLVLSCSWTLQVSRYDAALEDRVLLNISELSQGSNLSNLILNRALRVFPWETVLSTTPLRSMEDTFSGVFTVPRDLLGLSINDAKSDVRMFVDMKPLYDSFGLNLRLLVITPEVDFNAGFYDAMNVTLTIVGIVFGTFVILAGIVAFRLLLPLQALAESMQVTDSLIQHEETNSSDAPSHKDGGGGGGGVPTMGASHTSETTTSVKPQTMNPQLPSLSWLSEVQLIQSKYAQLKAQLRMVMGFLPRAVVDQLLRSEPLTDEDEEAGGVSDAVENFQEDDRVSPSQSVGSRQSTRSGMTPSKVLLTGRTDGTSASIAPNSGFDVMGRLESHLALSTKRVTVLVVNIRKFHSASSGTTAVHVAEALLVYTRLLCRTAEEHGGVVHALHGDHAVISFNASVRCTAHGEKAAVAAYDIAQRYSPAQRGPMERMTLTMGICTGVAIVGQAGSDMLKQFAIIGPVYNAATYLERSCKKYEDGYWPPTLHGHRILMDRQTTDQSETAVFSYAMDVLPVLRHCEASVIPVATVVSTIRGLIFDHRGGAGKEEDNRMSHSARRVSHPQGHGVGSQPNQDVEWMYALKTAHDQDPFREINVAFHLVCQGGGTGGDLSAATSVVDRWMAGKDSLGGLSQHHSQDACQRLLVDRLRELLSQRTVIGATVDTVGFASALLNTPTYAKDFVRMCL